MAEEQDQSQKTEEPTLKKLEDAKKKGQGVNSREVTNLVMLTAAAIVVVVILPSLMGNVASSMRPFIAEPHLIRLGDADAPSGLGNIGFILISTLGVPLAIFVVAALASGFLQRGINFSTEPVCRALNIFSTCCDNSFSLWNFSSSFNSLLSNVS